LTGLIGKSSKYFIAIKKIPANPKKCRSDLEATLAWNYTGSLQDSLPKPGLPATTLFKSLLNINITNLTKVKK
jgi:hypothetical protein